MKLAMELDVIVHRDADKGRYLAQVVQLPGCFAAGHTIEELEASLEEAVTVYLDDNDRELPPTTDQVEGLRRYRLENQRLIPA